MPKQLPELQKGKQWFGFLKIPEAKAGKFAIRHRHYPAGARFQTASTRTMIFAQHVPVQVLATEPVIVHELSEGDGVWMTDMPIEQAQIDPMLKSMRGRVLVGGLGLGYAAQVLARMPAVREVVVIERSPEVIELVARYIRCTGRRKVRVVCADLHEWLAANLNERFDWAFYDIWAPDGERILFEQVLPLRAQTGSIVNPENVRCWNEDVMRGQLLSGLVTRLHMLKYPDVFKDSGVTLERLCEPPKGTASWTRASREFVCPFFQAIRDGRIDMDDANRAADSYTANFGIPGRQLPTDKTS